MSAVRALEQAQATAGEPDDGADDAAVDLDERITVLAAAHDTLRQQLSSIDR